MELLSKDNWQTGGSKRLTSLTTNQGLPKQSCLVSQNGSITFQAAGMISSSASRKPEVKAEETILVLKLLEVDV